LCQVKIVVQWQVPKSTDTVIQHFGQAGCNSSIQAVAILIAEKGYFSKLRVEKRKAKFEASFHTNLKCKDSTISSIPPKHVTLGECRNIHYSQPLIMDTSPSSDIPHPDPNTINTDIPRASEVGDMSSGNEELQDDDNHDIGNAESNEDESVMEYPLDGPMNPEGAAAKTRSSE